MKTLTKIFQKGAIKEFKKNQRIISPDQKPPGVYLIRSGFAIVYGNNALRKRRIQTILKSGDMFPLVWAVNNTQKNIYVEALTKLSTYYISRKEFLHQIKNHNGCLPLITTLLTYLSTYIDRVDNLEQDSMQKKLISRILFYTSRFGIKKGKEIHIDVPLTHQLIADSINISRENVTRELKLLENEKLLSFIKHQLIIYDTQKLQKKLE